MTVCACGRLRDEAIRSVDAPLAGGRRSAVGDQGERLLLADLGLSRTGAIQRLIRVGTRLTGSPRATSVPSRIAPIARRHGAHRRKGVFPADDEDVQVIRFGTVAEQIRLYVARGITWGVTRPGPSAHAEVARNE